jgi:hypothetical protein
MDSWEPVKHVTFKLSSLAGAAVDAAGGFYYGDDLTIGPSTSIKERRHLFHQKNTKMMKAPGGPQKKRIRVQIRRFPFQNEFWKVKTKDAANGPTLGLMIGFQTEKGD